MLCSFTNAEEEFPFYLPSLEIETSINESLKVIQREAKLTLTMAQIPKAILLFLEAFSQGTRDTVDCPGRAVLSCRISPPSRQS